MTLEVRNLKVAYGPIEVVHGLDFVLDRGESISLLGPNGAGKTSSVEAIAGLLAKAGGSVMLNGVDITGLTANSVVRKGLALVTQWRDLFPNFTVEENLVAARAAAEGREPKSLDYAYDLFPVLKERRHLAAGSLSGGEQQMLAIGRALITSPSVLLLDEPSAGLAAGVVKVLLSVLDLIRQDGVGILLVEQKLEVAEAISDRCIVLSVGNVVWEGSMKDSAHMEEIRRAYFA